MDYLLSLGAREEAFKASCQRKAWWPWRVGLKQPKWPHCRDFCSLGFGSQVLLETRDVTEKRWDDVPIQLRNSALVEPFELVTEMYACLSITRKIRHRSFPFLLCFLWHDGRRYRLWPVTNGRQALPLKPLSSSLVQKPEPSGSSVFLEISVCPLGWSMALSLDLRCLCLMG